MGADGRQGKTQKQSTDDSGGEKKGLLVRHKEGKSGARDTRSFLPAASFIILFRLRLGLLLMGKKTKKQKHHNNKTQRSALTLENTETTSDSRNHRSPSVECLAIDKESSGHFTSVPPESWAVENTV